MLHQYSVYRQFTIHINHHYRFIQVKQRNQYLSCKKKSKGSEAIVSWIGNPRCALIASQQHKCAGFVEPSKNDCFFAFKGTCHLSPLVLPYPSLPATVSLLPATVPLLVPPSRFAWVVVYGVRLAGCCPFFGCCCEEWLPLAEAAAVPFWRAVAGRAGFLQCY